LSEHLGTALRSDGRTPVCSTGLSMTFLPQGCLIAREYFEDGRSIASSKELLPYSNLTKMLGSGKLPFTEGLPSYVEQTFLAHLHGMQSTAYDALMDGTLGYR